MKCKHCSEKTERTERSGLIHRIYAFYGYYPWRCPSCGNVSMSKHRGHAKVHRSMRNQTLGQLTLRDLAPKPPL